MKARDICDTAAGLVSGDRAAMHGNMLSNFTRIAALWNAYLGEDVVTPVDVGLMLALLKVARVKSGSHNMDNYVDLAGYAGCSGEVAAALKTK
jgi:hypothetical protein